MEDNCLSDMGYREIDMLADLLKLWADQKLTKLAIHYFNDLETHGFNCNSGYVWLQDGDYNTLMDNGGKLDLFINTPYNGIEGFIEDILNENNPDDLHKEDLEYISDMLQYIDESNLPIAWKNYYLGEDN